MSINVTVNGNRLNIRRGRMVLSDLDQIKKNERDRRRRLRLEQVRQQSKEISDRLLERTKNIAKEELKKFKNSDKMKQIYNEKIMEVQQKYQEDMADIGLAHISAALEPDHDALIAERERRNKLAALKRGKEATKQMKDAQQKETAQQQHQDRLRQVRDIENVRSTMVANIPKRTILEEDTISMQVHNDTDQENKQQKVAKKKVKKTFTKKSPGKITKTYIKVVGNDLKTHSPVLRSKTITVEENRVNESSMSTNQPIINTVPESLQKQTTPTTESEYNDKNCNKGVTNMPARLDKTSRYNPEDYIQTTSDSTNSDSSSSFSDDSSYFSDSGEQCVNKEIKTAKHVKCPAFEKVHLYDHNNRQSNVYDQPVGVVEKIQMWNEPSAIDLAQEMERKKAAEAQLSESRKQNAQKRGEDAVLREKVRRDYQNLMQNLNHLASEERKLKASQADCYPRDANIQEQRRKILRDEHKKKLHRALKTVIDDQCPSCPIERQITLTPRQMEKDDIRVTWEDVSSSSEHLETGKMSQKEQKETNTSREEQILEMLKKVERQKRLLLQEFGANLPNDIFNASVKSLFDKDKSVQTQETDFQNVDTRASPLSPEIKVVSVSSDEPVKKDRREEKENFSVRTVETAVQTIIKDKSVVQDKSVQVELEQEKKSERVIVSEEADVVSHRYPLEPQITVIRPQVETSDSTSSETIQAVNDNDQQSPRVTPKQKKYTIKTRKAPSKVLHKSYPPRANKATSPGKKSPKPATRSQQSSPKKHTGTEDVPSKKVKMYIDKSGINIKMKPPQVAEVAVDVSAHSREVYATDEQGQTATKSQWVQTKSRRIKIKDVSDTSTSFASPPPIQPRDLLEALSNNMSILEMLDSSANESMRRLGRDVSPVSTPETPSPRTMKIPSNIPHPDRLKKLLRYTTLDSQTNDTNTSSSTRNEYSTSTDVSEYPQSKRLSAENVSAHPRGSVSMQFCLCNNPECRQMHAKFDEIRNYAMRNCPHILQKYEDLQTTCAERIVSLTNLIEKVRSEQKGLEPSMIDSHDETSLAQLPSPQVVTMTNDLQSVRRLVENIEAIHNQLAKTLIESQKIIKNKAGVEGGTDEIQETVPLTNAGTSIKTIYTTEANTEIEESKFKPKIINEEKVNIKLNRLKVSQSPEILKTSTPKHDAWQTPNRYEEMTIEKLSKEILEQSEGINNNLMMSKETYSSVARNSIQTATNERDFKNNTPREIQKNDRGIKKQLNKESKKIKDFVPLLDDIPKVSKTIDNVMSANNGRSKPPVSLLSGPYRSEIESSGHELSTIVEFDTPDTANKSQCNRSPLSTKKIAESQITRPKVSKPVEYINSPLSADNPRLGKLSSASITKLSSAISASKAKETLTSVLSPKVSKYIENRSTKSDTNHKEDDIVGETSSKNFQCYTVNETPLQEQHFCSPSTDANKDCKSNKDKITSTSSNSFSELSGVSQIASTPSSTMLRYASSPEEMEAALKKLGLGWAITTLKKTREASALSSSSNSDATPMNAAKRIISPVKKQFDNNYGLPDFSDVSSISIKEASKSTEQAVLLKGRTSTPKLQNSNSNSGLSNTSNTNNSDNFQEPDDGLIIPNISLIKSKSNLKKLENQ